MTTIENIVRDGFVLDNMGLALLSLKLSLKAYFATYKSMQRYLYMFSRDFERHGLEETAIDNKYSSSYAENCTEAILHFHHFVELVCKGILRDEHLLLSDFTSSRHHVILHKLLNGESITDEDKQKLKSIEFSEAIKRLIALVKEGRIKNSQQWRFFQDQRNWLDQLNYIRNRLIHRGTFVLRYPALDKLFGEYALPFVMNVTSSDKYSRKEIFWKYLAPKCGVDPIDLIIEEFRDSRSGYNLEKIALLKELGRAAYEQPERKLYQAKEVGGNKYRPLALDTEHQQRAERIAKSETYHVADVRKCPVCGVSSFVIYLDYEDCPGCNRALCLCCTFGVNHYVKNPKEYAIPIDDFWHDKK